MTLASYEVGRRLGKGLEGLVEALVTPQTQQAAFWPPPALNRCPNSAGRFSCGAE